MKKTPHNPQREKAHFDRLASDHGEAWWGSATAAGKRRLQRRARMVSDAVRSVAQHRVLEIGCGTGAFSHALLSRFPGLRLVACDVSRASLELARARCSAFAHVAFVEADATQVPFAARSFDAVVGNSILHHLPVRSALRQCIDVLRPGGVLWLSEPNMLNPQIAVEKNVRPIGRLLQNTPGETAFFRWSISLELRRVGFHDVSVTPYDFLHPIVPGPLVGLAERIGTTLERLPILREVAGSLVIRATA